MMRRTQPGGNGCLIAPEVFEPVRRQLGVPDHVLDVLVAEPCLQRPRIVPGILKIVFRLPGQYTNEVPAPSAWAARRVARRPPRESRPLPRLAAPRPAAPHHARKLGGEGEAEPRPAVAARGQGIGLSEILKQ